MSRFGILLPLVFACLAACSQQAPEPVLIAGPTMGTSYSVKLAGPPSDLQPEELQRVIAGELERLESLMSTYRENSELSRFNRSAIGEWTGLSADTYRVMALSQEISRRTGGAFDVTVGPLVRLWGFGPDPRSAERPSAAAIADARARSGYRRLELEGGRARRVADIDVDLSAIAKGYAADRLADLLLARGMADFLVEVGGELRASGRKADGSPWRVAIEAPVDTGRQVQRVLRLEDGAVATSGDYRNYFEENGVRYSHTIDPLSGQPIRHRLASVSVLHASAAEADALATALMVMGPDRAYRFAIERDLAVFLIERTDAGFEERASPLFQLFLDD